MQALQSLVYKRKVCFHMRARDQAKDHHSVI